MAEPDPNQTLPRPLDPEALRDTDGPAEHSTNRPERDASLDQTVLRPDATLDFAPDPDGATKSYQFDPEATRVKGVSEANQPQHRQIPGYQILGVLGRGGMGIVYKAHHIVLDRTVALKMILGGAEIDSEMKLRFQQEAQAVARLQHPNIVQIFEIGSAGDLPFFSLEFVQGQTLSKKIGADPQPPRATAEMVETLARAMDVAHKAGIVHRDLKPGNVLLTQDGQPKIADFGLAKRLEAESGTTQSGKVLGTPSYMAPEQASGQQEIVGPPADIYALGAILYDMLTGRPPFTGSSVWDTLEMVRKMEPVSPSALTAKVPRDLETICLKCLQKEPSKRYGTALDLAEDLRRYLDNRPILARPVSPAEKAYRWVRRNPVIAGLTAAIVIVSLIFGSVSLWLKGQADENAKRANENAQKEERQRKIAEKAKDDEEAQRKLAEKSAQDAMTRLGIAIGAVRGLILEAQDALRTHPAGQALREKVTKLAMTEVEKIKEQALRVNITLLDRTEAGSMARMGDIFFDQNRPGDADELYAKAEEIILALKKRDPDDPIHIRNEAAIKNKRADAALRLGDVKKADSLYQVSLKLREDWVKQKPDLDAAKQSVAESQVLLGKTALRRGDPEAAIKHLAAAQASYAGLPKAITNAPAVLRELFGLRELIAQAEFRTGKIDEAEKKFNSILADRVKLDQQRSVAQTQRDIALSLLSVGDFAILSGRRSATAWGLYHKALPIFEKPLKVDPLNYFARRDVALTHFKLGVAVEVNSPLGAVLGSGFQTAAAEQHFQSSLAIRETLAKVDVLDTVSQIDLAGALGRCGRTADAIKIIDALLKAAPDDPLVRFYSACSLSMTARGAKSNGDDYAKHACELLAKLLQDGWKDSSSMQTEPTLQSARRHPSCPPLALRKAE